MSDESFRRLARKYMLGDVPPQLFLQELRRKSASASELLSYGFFLEAYQKGLDWPDMTHDDLERFNEFTARVDRHINEFFNIVNRTSSFRDDSDLLYPFTITWRVATDSRLRCDLAQLQLHFTREFLDTREYWHEPGPGPWFFSFWIIYDDELFDLGDPASYYEETVTLTWHYPTFIQLLESFYDRLIDSCS